MSITQILRVMKLTAILLTGCCVHLMAAAGAQTISYSAKNASLKEVFKVVKKQTGYFVVYNATQVNTNLPVSVNAKDLPLTQFLNAVLKDIDLEYTIENKTIVISLKAKKPTAPVSSDLGQGAQASIIDIWGKVTDESGKPVVGASVMVKGANKGTITNNDGDFMLTGVDTKAILVISAINIEKIEIAVNNKTNVGNIIVRSKVDELDKIIIRAYGTTTKRMNTGSISKITSEDIAKQPIADPLSALSGRVSGLQIRQFSGMPGSYQAVQLRGRNSIANGNDPLYIVDGVPFPSSILNSTFVGGGVVSSPLSNLNPSEIESIEVLKDADATAIYGSRGANGVILITTKAGNSGKPQTNIRVYTGAGKISRTMKMLNTSQYLAMRREAFSNDGVVTTATNAKDLLLWDTTRYTDWQKTLIGETMHQTNADISVSGGTSQTQFSFGGSYYKETPTIPGNFSMQKYSTNVTVGHSSKNGAISLQLSTRYLFNHKVLPGGDGDITRMITLAPVAPALFKTDGSLNWENSTWENPFLNVYQVFTSNSENFITNLNLNVRITKNLRFKFSGGYDRLSTVDHQAQPMSSLNPSFNQTGSARFGNRSIANLIGEPQISYEPKFNNANFLFTAGASFQSSQDNGLFQSAKGYTSDALINSIRAAATITTSSETKINYRYIGFFAHANYDYRKKYIVSATVRRDGSSRYGENSRFANFGSLGIGWIISSENFMKQQTVVSFAKLRASAGVTGNDQIGDYKYMDLYSPGIYPYLGTTTFSPAQLFNNDYSWEKVKKYQVGADLGLWNNRVLVTANYYNNITENQLVSYPLPTLSGFSGILRNIPAVIRNNGIELEISATILSRKTFNWEISGNMTFPHNKLVSYQGLENSTYANRYVIGHPLSIFKKFEYTGVDPLTGVYTFNDFDNDGRITSPNDSKSIINTSQDFYGGLENTFRIGKVTASMLFSFAQELNGENYLSFFSRPGLMVNQPDIVFARWQKPGDITGVQRFSISNATANTAFSNYRQSNAAYSNASYIRLRNIYVAYDINSDKLRKKSILDFKLFVQCQNLFTITGFYGLDPESKTALPPNKMITGGIQIKF
ncbi:MAG: SusC/RagA family TonB-linked outer membrane protein [Sediminibacterium sp.]|nr:SusC/RagA family TonB-linked outer membrane protein [Sediminibacterium sp.]